MINSLLQQDTKAIRRNKADLKTDGIIIFGQEIDDKGYFDVSILKFP
jgi:hypothetical protein